MNLKFYRVDIPSAHIMTFTTFAHSKAEALSKITDHSVVLLDGYWSGFSDSRHSIEVGHSRLLLLREAKRIRSAEPGTKEEKAMLRVRMRPSFALVTMEAVRDEY